MQVSMATHCHVGGHPDLLLLSAHPGAKLESRIATATLLSTGQTHTDRKLSAIMETVNPPIPQFS